MEREANQLRRDTLQMCWHMRGGLTYSEGMQLSSQERSEIAAIIKEHMETTKKSGLPYF